MAMLAASSLRTEQRYYEDDSRNNHREVCASDRGHFSRASRDGRNAIKAFSHLTIKSKTALAGHNLLAKLLIIA